jgi:hypothetical protein
MVINTNTSAQNAAQLLGQSSTALSKSLARLSSGSKITSPADDSAGLAVSMKMNAQISRTNAAQSNVGNAISFNQTQDGYLSKVNDALNRMSELSVLAQDVTKTTSDRPVQYGIRFLADLRQRRGHQGFQRRQPVRRQLTERDLGQRWQCVQQRGCRPQR